MDPTAVKASERIGHLQLQLVHESSEEWPGLGAAEAAGRVVRRVQSPVQSRHAPAIAELHARPSPAVVIITMNEIAIMQSTITS